MAAKHFQSYEKQRATWGHECMGRRKRGDLRSGRFL